MAEKQSLGSLVTGVTEDLSSLIRGEIELAKTELRDSAQVASKGAGLIAAAVGVASMAGLFLLLTFAWLLVQWGLPYWAAFGIVTLILAIVAVVLGLVGRKQLQDIKGLERSNQSLAKTRELLAKQTGA
jgi:tetrahydromethanopterin S-methyltransferase subunit C